MTDKLKEMTIILKMGNRVLLSKIANSSCFSKLSLGKNTKPCKKCQYLNKFGVKTCEI